MRSPLVSVIITTKNEESNIKNCLKSIKNQSYNATEIIVIDNVSSDNTKEIAREFTSNVLNKGPERSAQRNFGAKKANGKFLLFLDADMILEKNVVIECVNKIEQDNQLQAIIIPERSFGIGFWAKCKALERSFYVGVDWMEAARFFRKEVFIKLQGYNEKNTGTEDYDLPQRLQAKYGNDSIGRVSEYIMHNEGNLSLIKSMKKKYYYAKNLSEYVNNSANKKNYSKQSSLVKRYLLFFSNPTKLFENPIYGIGMLFLKTAEFTAGFLGTLFVTKSSDKITC